MAKPAWFKHRTYKHFDVPVGLDWADGLTPEIVASHAWSPLMHWIKEVPRYKAELRKTEIKKRDIMHPSHRDACILAKYSAVVSERLDAWYAAKSLGQSVIANRALGKSNYHFAETAQAFVRQRGAVEAMCFDVTGFFDNIEHKRLKQRLKWLLETDELSSDWHGVFRAVTKYSAVRRADLNDHPVFSKRMKQRSSQRPIATVKELKAAGIPIAVNKTGIGVPQGTPISASLSNLYLVDFDLAMKRLADEKGALYQRYSDDILIICQPEHADEFAAAVEAALNAEALELQDSKTVRQRFDGNNQSDFQYLGYQLGHDDALVRPGSLSRQWRTLKRAMKRSRFKAQKLAAAGERDKIFTKKLRRRFTQVGARNFLAYADRSAEQLESKAIRQQIKRLRKYAAKHLADVKAIKNS
jgi:hypothetical protein